MTPRKSREPEIYEDKPLPDTPSSSSAATPVRRPFVGPTPQKDGRVLGLFDSLESPAATMTPTKADAAAKPVARLVLDATTGNRTKVPLTPSKARLIEDTYYGSFQNENAVRTPSSGSGSNGRTPPSSGTRFLLDKYATPSKRKRSLDTAHSNRATTSLPGTLGAPQAQQPDTFSTPAFLRRDSDRFVALSAVAEEDEADDGILVSDGINPTSPSSRPLSRRSSFHPPRPRFNRTFGRTLSSLMADVRKAEDERYDDDLEALRDVEDEEFPAKTPGSTIRPAIAGSQAPEAFGPHDNDSSNRLGPDGMHANSSDEDAATAAVAENSGRRVYKKKGAKRQTRRVILRPAKKLPRPEAVVAAVQETQLLSDSTSSAEEERKGAEEEEEEETTVFPYPASSDSEHRLSRFSSPTSSAAEEDVESKNKPSPHKRRKITFAESNAAGSTSKKTTTHATSEGKQKPNGNPVGEHDIRSSNLEVVRKAAKKVNAAAHANFRRLKIRSSKGAAGGGASGKFGRRR